MLTFPLAGLEKHWRGNSPLYARAVFGDDCCTGEARGGPSMQADEFETRLRQDLPRGHAAQAKSTGRERGLFARWLTHSEMSGERWRHEGGLLLGRRGGRLIGWKDDRHVMTIAGSRAGKGVSLIIPNLLLYEGSALVIDPKGENARITARRRGKGANGLGQDVYVLDPFGVSGGPSSSFNPLGELDTASEDLIEDAGMFADALITHPDRGERHWTESAQALLRALILAVAGDENPARRNLVTVRKLLMLTDEKIRDRQFEHPPSLGKLEAQEALIQILLAEDVKPYGYICAGIAEQLKAMGDNERGSVLSAARTQTQWLDSAKIHPVLAKSDFSLADLKGKRTTIYLCSAGRAYGDACALASPDDLAGAVGHGTHARQAEAAGIVRARRVPCPRPHAGDRDGGGSHGRFWREALDHHSECRDSLNSITTKAGRPSSPIAAWSPPSA